MQQFLNRQTEKCAGSFARITEGCKIKMRGIAAVARRTFTGLPPHFGVNLLVKRCTFLAVGQRRKVL